MHLQTQLCRAYQIDPFSCRYGGKCGYFHCDTEKADIEKELIELSDPKIPVLVFTHGKPFYASDGNVSIGDRMYSVRGKQLRMFRYREVYINRQHYNLHWDVVEWNGAHVTTVDLVSLLKRDSETASLVISLEPLVASCMREGRPLVLYSSRSTTRTLVHHLAEYYGVNHVTFQSKLRHLSCGYKYTYAPLRAVQLWPPGDYVPPGVSLRRLRGVKGGAPVDTRYTAPAAAAPIAEFPRHVDVVAAVLAQLPTLCSLGRAAQVCRLWSSVVAPSVHVWQAHVRRLCGSNPRLLKRPVDTGRRTVGSEQQAGEGALTVTRQMLVDKVACERYANRVGLREFILTDDVIVATAERGLRADAFEAVIGAVYLDDGYERCKEWFVSVFSEDFRPLLQQGRNWKSELQEWLQARGERPPVYTVVEEAGPDHRKTFVVEVTFSVGGRPFHCRGTSATKKLAQKEAARVACQQLAV